MNYPEGALLNDLEIQGEEFLLGCVVGCYFERFMRAEAFTELSLRER